MGQNDYLAHSKGPWKKHKYVKKVGNRYYYAGSKGYYKALATTNDDSYSDSEKKAAKRINARNANEANLKRASRKQKVKNVGVSARLKAQKAGNAVKEATAKAKTKVAGGAYVAKTMAKRATTNAKRSVSAASARVKTKAAGNAYVAKTMAKRAKVNANRNIAKTKVKAAGNAYVAKTMSKRAAKKARRSVSAATSYGKSAINKLFTNAKGRARLVKANASAAAIKRKQAKRAKARKKA